VRAQDEYPIRVDAKSLCVDVVWRQHSQAANTHNTHSLNTQSRGVAGVGASVGVGVGNKLRRERFHFDDVFVGSDREKRFRRLVQAQVRSALLRSCTGVGVGMNSRRGVLTYVLTGSSSGVGDDLSGNGYGNNNKHTLEYTLERVLGTGSSSGGGGYAHTQEASQQQQSRQGLVSDALGMLFYVLNQSSSTLSASTLNNSGRISLDESTTLLSQSAMGSYEKQLPQVTLSILHTFDDQVVDLLPSNNYNNADEQPSMGNNSRVQLRRRKDGSICVTGATKVSITSVSDYVRIVGGLLGRRQALRDMLIVSNPHLTEALNDTALSFPRTSRQAINSQRTLRMMNQSHASKGPHPHQQMVVRETLRNRLLQSNPGAGRLVDNVVDAVPESRWALHEGPAVAGVETKSGQSTGDSILIVVAVSGRCLLPRRLVDNTTLYNNMDSSEFGSLYHMDEHDSANMMSTPISFTLNFVCPIGPNWNHPGSMRFSNTCWFVRFNVVSFQVLICKIYRWLRMVSAAKMFTLDRR
jgi:hypothetical protein